MSGKLLVALTAAVLALPALGVVPPVARAQSTPAKSTDLTPEEMAEREQRKGCKVAICAAMRAQKAGDDVACTVIKSWRKENLDEMVKRAGVSWPWGRVRCTADIKLKRDMLVRALVEPKFEATIDKHTVACEVEREKDKAEIKFSLAPKVSFEGGKAVKATMNWGTIEAPALVKGAMWTATATDNTFNVLERSVVDDINAFTGERCDEVKADWQK